MFDINDAVAIDLETTGFSWGAGVLCFSAAKINGDSLFVNLGYRQSANLFGFAFGKEAEARDRALEPMTIPLARSFLWGFIGGAKWLVFHNGSFDIPFLIRLGVITREELVGVNVFDTLVMARCTNSHESVALGNLVYEFGIEHSEQWRAMKRKRASLSSIDIDSVENYALEDAVNTIKLAEKIAEEYGQVYDDDSLLLEESEWIKLVSMMRVNGIRGNEQGINDLREQKAAEHKKLLGGINKEITPYRLRSANDRTGILKWIEYGIGQKGNLNLTEKGNPSIDEASLLNIRGDEGVIVVDILKARVLEKQIATWIDGTLGEMCDDGRVHPLYAVSGARTNRLSCRKPNVQAYPGDLFRVAFTASDESKLVSIDYKQVELRLAAMFAAEKSLAIEFARPDADPHMATARLMYGEASGPKERQIAKQVNFLSIYGGGSYVLSEEAGISVQRAKEILADHRIALPKMADTLKAAEYVWKTKKRLKVLGGKFSYASNSDLERSYKAFNALVQGSVAELMKKAMISIGEELIQVTLVCQIHDSIIMEIPDDGDFDLTVSKAEQIMAGAIPAWLSERTDPPIRLETDVTVY
jgi:DNA polymerase I-like protein with 3'-5' exonuclease and polymerase domains